MFDHKNAQCLITIASSATDVRKRWTETLHDICLLHEATDLISLKRNLSSLKPSVILLDQRLPGFIAAEHLAELQRLSSLTKILLFFDSVDQNEIIEALRLGVSGCFHRDIDPVLLRKAIEVVRKGEIWVSRNIITALIQALATPRSAVAGGAEFGERMNGIPQTRQSISGQNLTSMPELNLSRLTFREQQIAQLVASGGSNKEIASRLRITESTVKAHLTAIFRKVGVPDRLGLALFIAQHAQMHQ